MPSHPAFLSSRWIACFMAFCLFQPPLAAAQTRVIEARRYDDALSGLAVSFLARDLATDTDYVLEGSTLDRRHTPLSTFKIANLVIALETGVAALAAGLAPGPDARTGVPPLGRLVLPRSHPQDRERYVSRQALPVGLWQRRGAGGIGRFLARQYAASLGRRAGGLPGEAPCGTSRCPSPDYLRPGPRQPDLSNAGGAFSGWYASYLRRQGREPVVFALHVAEPSFRAIAEFRRAVALRVLTDVGPVN